MYTRLLDPVSNQKELYQCTYQMFLVGMLEPLCRHFLLQIVIYECTLYIHFINLTPKECSIDVTNLIGTNFLGGVFFFIIHYFLQNKTIGNLPFLLHYFLQSKTAGYLPFLLFVQWPTCIIFCPINPFVANGFLP